MADGLLLSKNRRIASLVNIAEPARNELPRDSR